MKNKTIWWLSLLLGLGLFLRVYNVAGLPSILNRDEAALAYNAYLLKETGQDEFSRPWPTMLESFGDFKLPGYPILLVGSFFLLGLNDFAVRLPSALAGVALIGVGYFWGIFVFRSRKMALLLAGMITISPIFWFYSRVAYEANVALTLFAAALGLLIGNKKAFFWADVTAIGLIWFATITYNTPLLLLPFIILLLPVMRGLKNARNWLGPTLALVIVFSGVFSQLWTLTSQKSGITIFSDESYWMQSVEYRDQYQGLAQKVLGNKYIFFGKVIFQNLLASFSPEFLVTKGGTHPWHSIDSWGHLYWSMYLFGLVGFVTAILSLINSAFKLLKRRVLALPADWWLVYLTFAALAPAVITVDAPHATRSLLFFFIWLVWAAKSMFQLEHTLHKIDRFRPVFFWLAIIIWFVFSTLNYGQKYFIGYAKRQPLSLKPGYETILQIATQRYPEKKIAIVDPDGYQYILTAWYLKTPPAVFQSSIVKQLPNQIGFRYGERFDRFHFIGRPTDAAKEGEEVILDWTGQEWVINNEEV